jgi:hypothetical protein
MLVIGELSLALALRSFINLMRVDAGVRPITSSPST